MQNYGPGRGCIINSGQKAAKNKILAELKKLPKTDIQIVTCRAKQSDLKRRQDYGKKKTLEPPSKKKKPSSAEMGELATFPGLREHLFLACAGPVPTVKRLHLPIQLIGEGIIKYAPPNVT